MAAAVRGAAAVGYRHIDCAAVYGNEDAIGAALADVWRGGARREEFWITSKLWNDQHAEADVIPACRKSLADLKLEYLDLFLVHWPFPNFHPPGCDVTSRSAEARPYIHESFMRTWRQMEKVVELGLVRHIGTSNMTIPKLELLLRDCRVRPAVNELEMHPHFQQNQLFEFVCAQGIQPVAYCPLGSPHRPERDRTPDDTADLEDPVIVRLAEARGAHPAQVCLQWSVERGAVPIPMSTNRRNYRANLAAVAGKAGLAGEAAGLADDKKRSSAPLLTEAEMRAIAGIDRNCRLVKGQVFLWKAEQGWEDLWDLDGRIAQ